MAFALKLRKYPKKKTDKLVRDAAGVLGIGNLLDRRPKALSGGQRQRVALGRAIVRQPKAFLFDEPPSNLDAKLRVEMRAELKRLHNHLKTTTIYVTHDQEEAMTLGQRIVVMKDGLVQQCSTPLEVYQRPVNRFVAGFVGTPPMNFFEGKVLSESGKLYFDEGAAKIRLPAEWSDRISSLVGRQAVLGVRPEVVSTTAHDRFSGEENSLPVRIDVIEPLGEKMDLHVSTPTHGHIVARVDVRRDLNPGDPLKLYLDVSRTHLFEPGELGANVSLPQEQGAAASG